MDRWVDIQLGTKSYQPRSGTQSIERLVNLYAEASEPGAKTPVALYSDPGLLAWTDLSASSTRGLHRAHGHVWAVVDTSLYAINQTTKAATLIGTVEGIGPVRIVSNETQVLIVTDNYAYCATLTSLMTLPLTGFSSVCLQDGYGILVKRDTDEVYITSLDDLDTVGALDFTTVDAKPDNAIACASHSREVWVLGEETIEVLANTGAASFPFSRAAYIEHGILAPGSLAQADGSLLWLDNGKRVRRSNGYQATPVSTPAIDGMIAEAYSPSTAEAFTYTQAGHTHYVLSFADLTLAYDLRTGLWRERRSFGLDRWRAQSYCRIGADTHLVGDYASGKIYELDLSTYSEDGEVLQREVVMPPLSAGSVPVSVHELEVDFEAGVGLTSGQGSAPTWMLAWSDDDGRTWSNDREASLGPMGQYRRRARFTRLGRARNRSIRLRVSDPNKVSIFGVRARMEASVA